MAYRTFTDRDGHSWEIRNRSFREWEFVPGGNNPRQAVIVQAPGYEKDPYEMSKEELQQLLDGGASPTKRERKSPFKD